MLIVRPGDNLVSALEPVSYSGCDFYVDLEGFCRLREQRHSAYLDRFVPHPDVGHGIGRGMPNENNGCTHRGIQNDHRSTMHVS